MEAPRGPVWEGLLAYRATSDSWWQGHDSESAEDDVWAVECEHGVSPRALIHSPVHSGSTRLHSKQFTKNRLSSQQARTVDTVILTLYKYENRPQMLKLLTRGHTAKPELHTAKPELHTAWLPPHPLSFRSLIESGM